MNKTFRHNDFTAEFSDEGTDTDNRYFSFTGSMDGGSGAMGDDIIKIYPAFRILNELHLAKLDGEPMYALENGFYHFKESGYKIEELEKYWNIKLSENQINKIIGSWVPNGHGADSGQKGKKAVKEVMEEIRPLWAEKVKQAYILIKSTPEDLTEINEDININDFDDPAKVRALANFLEVHFSIIEESGAEYTAQGETWLVLTDEEADEKQDEYMDNYVEELIMPDLPENMQRYFDVEAWKSDARMDGRGILSSYDGEEIELTDPVDGSAFYAYKQ